MYTASCSWEHESEIVRPNCPTCHQGKDWVGEDEKLHTLVHENPAWTYTFFLHEKKSPPQERSRPLLVQGTGARSSHSREPPASSRAGTCIALQKQQQ